MALFLVLIFSFSSLAFSQQQGEHVNPKSCLDETCERVISLPELDLHMFIHGDETERNNILSRMDSSLRQYGVFRIANHNISADLMQQLFEKGKQFFDSPKEWKLKFRSSLAWDNGFEPSGLGQLGENIPFPENIASFWSHLERSNVEGVTCPSSLCPLMTKFSQDGHDAAMAIYEMFSTFLGMKKNYFRDVNAMADEYFSEFRLWNYLAAEKGNGERLGSHKDWGNLAFIRADVAGFQVKEFSKGEWVSISSENVADDSLIVVIGELVEMITSGYWKAPLHRVATISEERRMSLVYFDAPRLNFVVDAAAVEDCEKCVDGNVDVTRKKFGLPKLYGNHVKIRFHETYEGDKNQVAEWLRL